MGDKKLYVKNLQGDIMRIVDENGNSIAIYAYDQWGKPTQMRKPSSVNTDLVNYNPFLYRGYVYDSDSGLYYLQSRYYDPTTGRFLNADKYCDMGMSVLGTNMFSYCENGYISFMDYNGCVKCYITATLRNRYDKAIINSNLHTKRGSVFSSRQKCKNNDPKVSYTGMSKRGGYEVYTYTKMIGTRYIYQSEYYAFRKTDYQWNRYLDDNWGFFNCTKKAIEILTEILSYHSNYYVSNISQIINFCLSNYVPKSEQYFITQMVLYGNICDNGILIFIKVINKKLRVNYDKKTKKNKIYCFETNTYYAYW